MYSDSVLDRVMIGCFLELQEVIPVRLTLVTVPSPQERQRRRREKMIILECFSVETKWNPKRTRQGTNYYMS